MASTLMIAKLLGIGIGVIVGWFLGGLDTLVYALVILIVVDYITQVMRGVITKRLSSAAGTRIIFQKITIILLIGVANVIDLYLIRSPNAPLKTAVTFFYITNQGISLLENAAIVGIPIPSVLREVLVKLQKTNE